MGAVASSSRVAGSSFLHCPVVLADDGAGEGIDPHVPPIGRAKHFNIHVPSQVGVGRVVQRPGQAGHDVAAGHVAGGEGLAGFGAAFLREPGRGVGTGGHVQMLQGPVHGGRRANDWGSRQGRQLFGRHESARVRNQPVAHQRQRLHAVEHRNAPVQLLHIHMFQAVSVGVGTA